MFLFNAFSMGTSDDLRPLSPNNLKSMQTRPALKLGERGCAVCYSQSASHLVLLKPLWRTIRPMSEPQRTSGERETETPVARATERERERQREGRERER